MEREREKGNVTVLSHLVPAEFHPSAEGHASSSGLYHSVCEHQLVLVNFSDRGKRGFSMFEIL